MNTVTTNGPARTGPFFFGARSALIRIDGLSRLVVVAAMGVMATLVVVQVVCRYVFGISIDWSEEVARLAFVWAMFLAIPHGIRSGIHVGIDAVVVNLPDPVQESLFRLSSALGATLMIVVFYFGWQVTIDTWPEMMPTLSLTAAVYYIAVLVAAVHSVLHLLLLVWGGRRTWQGVEFQ